MASTELIRGSISDCDVEWGNGKEVVTTVAEVGRVSQTDHEAVYSTLRPDCIDEEAR
jgi:hypothetical protein